jgi:hypothetical protein
VVARSLGYVYDSRREYSTAMRDLVPWFSTTFIVPFSLFHLAVVSLLLRLAHILTFGAADQTDQFIAAARACLRRAPLFNSVHDQAEVLCREYPQDPIPPPHSRHREYTRVILLINIRVTSMPKTCRRNLHLECARPLGKDSK